MELVVRDVTGGYHPFEVGGSTKVKDLRLRVAAELGLAAESILLEVNGEVFGKDAEHVAIGSLAVVEGDEVRVVEDRKGAALARLRAMNCIATPSAAALAVRKGTEDMSVLYADAELLTRQGMLHALSDNAAESGRIANVRAVLTTDFGYRLMKGLAPRDHPVTAPIKAHISRGRYMITKAILELNLPRKAGFCPYVYVKKLAQSAQRFFPLFFEHGYTTEKDFHCALRYFTSGTSGPSRYPDHVLLLLRMFPNFVVPLSCIADLRPLEPLHEALVHHSGGIGLGSKRTYCNQVMKCTLSSQDAVLSLLRRAHAERPFSGKQIRKMLIKAARNMLPAVVGFLKELGGDVSDAMVAWPTVRELRWLVEELGAEVDSVGKGGVTALVRAVIASDHAAVEYLVKKGADCNHRTRDGATPLLLAARRLDVRIASMLLEHGADPETATPHGNNAVMHAAAEGCLEMVDFLLSKSILPRGKSLAIVNAGTPRKGNLVKAFVKRDPSEATSADAEGRTVLMHLARVGNPCSDTLFDMLLPSITCKCKKGVSALGYAVSGNRRLAMKILQHKHKPCVDKAASLCDEKGMMGDSVYPLLEAVCLQQIVHWDVVEALLKNGCKMTLGVWKTFLSAQKGENRLLDATLVDNMMLYTNLSTEGLWDLLMLFTEHFPHNVALIIKRNSIHPRVFRFRTFPDGSTLTEKLTSKGVPLCTVQHLAY
eukprot:TRINITY_DN22754_c0_g1_i1.p1 TRINITY_DN22754_c0_g1~~TRINITY_DN22754_c0_g1_i1.p1  ORF type:complete len:724 (+),score=119.04 TRINITY_DN22754_c0_g1_i1:40-2172(+)